MSFSARTALVCTSTFALGGVAAPAAQAATPVSSSFGGYSAVGALFPNTSAVGAHTCTASVVSSASHDTIITAAHCLSGSGTGYSFAPGYVSGLKPHGTWHVTHSYIDSRWKTSRNPLYDVAVLTVAKTSINGRLQNIQDVTGAEVLRSAPAAGALVTVPAYNSGTGDRPIRCTTRAYYTGSYPGFNCTNYNGGVSGAPFVQTIGSTSYVSGVIGGRHQGGCFSSTSYSAPFGPAEQALVGRAQAKSAADVIPSAGSDGC